MRNALWCDRARSKCQVDADKWPAVADKLVIVRRRDVTEPYRSSVLQTRRSQQGSFLSSTCVHVFVRIWISVSMHMHLNVCRNACVFTHVWYMCVCLPLHLCRQSAQVIRSRVQLSCGGSGVFYSCRRRLPTTPESNVADHSVSAPSRRRRLSLPLSPKRRLMSQIATGWVFIATCGCFWVCRSRSPKVNLSAWLPGAHPQLSLCRNTRD